MNVKCSLSTIAIVLIAFSSGIAQQQFPADTASTPLNRLQPDTYLALAGETSFTNYSFAVSFPVFWIENRVKMVPLAGLFWNDFANEGFDFNPAFGAKFLYYFQKQYVGRPHTNSFYAGLGGMGTTRDSFGSSFTERSRAGIRLGYDYTFKNVAIAPELRLDVDNEGIYYPGIGVVLHFGY